MSYSPEIEYASLSETEEGYILKFQCKDWARAIGCLTIERLNGFTEFVKGGELVFTEIQICEKDVPAFVHVIEEKTGWHLIRFDLKESSQNRIIDFYTGEMYIGFSRLAAIETFLKAYTENTSDLFDKLLLNIEHDIISTEPGFLVIPKMEGRSLGTNDSSPF